MAATFFSLQALYLLLGVMAALSGDGYNVYILLSASIAFGVLTASFDAFWGVEVE